LNLLIWQNVGSTKLSQQYRFAEIVGQSPAIAKLVEKIELVAPTDATALISGESGTGKELVAREIHRRSQRKDHPLVRVNCASIPRELYESEFFGHAKGAFTGALKDRAGRFQEADGGTLFLDEVGEIPLEMQSKLLRVLQEGEYERVGEETTRKVNVRIIAATNRKLAQEVEAKRFRQDLYYRLNVFPIEAWIQLVSATVNEVVVSKNTSWGVRKPRVFLGRWFRFSLATVSSCSLPRVRFRSLGKNWRMSPLVFSLTPRSQDAYG